MLDYELARQNTFKVAEVVSKLIKYLNKEYEVDYDKVTIVGFSLGGI